MLGISPGLSDHPVNISVVTREGGVGGAFVGAVALGQGERSGDDGDDEESYSCREQCLRTAQTATLARRLTIALLDRCVEKSAFGFVQPRVADALEGNRQSGRAVEVLAVA